jgi:glutamine phosphoribosylpyrophosphate amidotransferase
MENIINIYNSILINKIKYLMNNSIIKIIDETQCKICKEKFNEKYTYGKIKFSKLEFHQLIYHYSIYCIFE